MNGLAEDLARALDPVRLCEKVGMVPDPWQAQVLRSQARRILLNCSRQSGKSTVAAVLAVHQALYSPGSLTLIVSPSHNQSRELFRVASTIYRTMGRPVEAQQESRLSLTLENESRIVSLPGSETTVRGYANVALLIVDEAARVDDELWLALQPMLAVSGGRVIAMSTPFGRRGWWYEAWCSEEDWERYEFPALACPRISPAFLEQARREMGDWWFRQEYMCEFLDSATQVFGSEFIDGMFSEEVDPWAL